MLITCQKLKPSSTTSPRLLLPRSNTLFTRSIAILATKGQERRLSYLRITSSHVAMQSKEKPTEQPEETRSTPSFNLLFVEMGVGYDQHGQDITVAAMRACKDAISSNSIPAFRQGTIPGVNSDQMKLKIQLGVPRSTQHLLDADRVKSVFPYGEIISFEVVDGGMICSSGTCIEAMGDKNDDCYIVNAAIYVGY
ncbi:50S ribosomal protein L34 [Rhynchospora pubera]|uniref:50S ribosomal protein L34 n=1 Tax=Rhynchospora pubera TaxID=906938 RepID=A0AAV8DN07_9POAL|nr:50S ribosomal protein L34 [Rhynchospora pubera]